MKSKSKTYAIEYKKQYDLFVKLKKCCKKGFFGNLEIKSNSKPLGSIFKSYLSNNMQRVTQILSLLNIIKFYLIKVK